MPDTGTLPSAAVDAAARNARGIHHLALTTEDMQATTDFVVNVIGMPLVHAMTVPPGVGVGPKNRGNPPYEEIRHYFFDMGNDSLLAYFETPKGEKGPSDRDAIGGMQHCAFVVTNEQLKALRGRLEKAGVPYDGPVDILPGLQSVYFYDPSGIRFEACCQPGKGEAPGVIASVLQTKAEARQQLETTGASEEWIRSVVEHLPD